MKLGAASAAIAVAALTAAVSLSAQTPEIREYANRDIDFVPAGWTLYDKVEGDLNGDGVADSALVIQAANPANVFENPDGLGAARYDANARILLVVMSDPEGPYRLVGRDDEVIPNRYSAVIDDPYSDLLIEDGKLMLMLNFWASAGSWMTSSHTFRFRWDGTEMEVIGYDFTEVHRGSGELKQVSVNFLTNRKSELLGRIDDDVASEAWSGISPDLQPKFGAIGNGFEFNQRLP